MLAHQALVQWTVSSDHIQLFLTTLLRLTVIPELLVLRASVIHMDFSDGMVSYWDKSFSPPRGIKARRNSVFLLVMYKSTAHLISFACVSRRHSPKGLMIKMKTGSWQSRYSGYGDGGGACLGKRQETENTIPWLHRVKITYNELTLSTQVVWIHHRRS